MIPEPAIHGLISALLASFGALAHLLSKKEKSETHMSDMVSTCLVASFSGVLVHFVSTFFEFPTNLGYLLACISGWLGPQIIVGLITAVLEKTGLGNFIKPPDVPDSQNTKADDIKHEADDIQNE